MPGPGDDDGGGKEEELVSLFDLLEDLDGKPTCKESQPTRRNHKQSGTLFLKKVACVCVGNSGAVPGGVPESGGRGCGVGWRLLDQHFTPAGQLH